MTQTPNPAEARKQLRKLMRDRDLSAARVGHSIGRSAPAVLGYLDGDIPAEATRKALERFCGIPAWLWGLTAKEKAEERALARVVPLAPPDRPAAA